LALRLRWGRADRRVHCVLPTAQARRRRPATDPHHPRHRLRPAPRSYRQGGRMSRVFRPSRSMFINVGLVVLIIAGGAWACFLAAGGSDGATAAPSSGLRTATVSQGEITATVSASGSIESTNTASADFATSGTVISISVHVGDAVKKSQVLAKVD